MTSDTIEPGTLYVVATPIGNLGDMTIRAAETLRAVDLVASEDTRRTGRLLKHIGSTARQVSYHDHNAEQRLPSLLQHLHDGGTIAQVSDAGTPAISDPGFRLVRAARESGFPVVPIPGASAVTTALSAAGLPTDRFVFLGFLPVKKGKARRALEQVATLPFTLVLYVSPYKLATTLTLTLEALGDRPACVCRELTKLHETFDRAPLSDLAARYPATSKVKGEITLLIEGA
jgi:16S rRNA (cytidine1402-2'-O)-methyltransferase